MTIDRRSIGRVNKKEKTISSYSKEELKRIVQESRKEREKGFRALGIEDKKALRFFVEAPGITPQSLREKLDVFKKVGFSNPLEIFNKFPVMYNFEPQRIISFLQEKFTKKRYFNFPLSDKDIIKIIEHFPGCVIEGTLSGQQIKKALEFITPEPDSVKNNVSKNKNR
ncbi:MAG: hypothetical protein KatS3mg097_070 [Candidatus Parcubacteria bacterium]|nr:MAG: hypothetical protein KatS3mg097_070 [Candidatus Parcubacteria bacterium]